MRLWHVDLIPMLPDKQLQGQWRECCLIAKGLHDGTLNHLLVNNVKEYPIEDFITYSMLVFQQMKKRGKNPIWERFGQYTSDKTRIIDLEKEIFPGWHNERYLRQCFYNLQEKFDCGGIPVSDWIVISETIYDKI